MKKSLCFTLSALLGLCLVGTQLTSCTKDSVPTLHVTCDTCALDTITYTNGVQAILVRTCNQTGASMSCHPANGEYVSTFTAVHTITANGLFASSVLDGTGNTMPKPIAPIQLTASELDTLRRWRDAGYPE